MTVTVDPELVEAGHRAVAGGDADSLSGWVSEALAEKVARNERVEQLQLAVEAHEAEFGEITAAEMASQRRADREDAVVMRGRRSGSASTPRRRGKAASA